MKDFEIVRMEKYCRIDYKVLDNILRLLSSSVELSGNHRHIVDAARINLGLVGTGTYNPDRENELCNTDDHKYAREAEKLLSLIRK